MLSLLTGGLTKIMAGLIAILLLIAGGMCLWNRALRAEIKTVEADYQQLNSVYEGNLETLRAVEAEKQKIAQILAARIEHQKQIERTAQARLMAKERELKTLRGKYEKVNDFLSLPVPVAFVDNWMRQPGGEGRDDKTLPP